MAIRLAVVALLVVFAFISYVRADFHLECRILPPEECSFAVDYDGYRCVLDKVRFRGINSDLYVCEKSSVKTGEYSPVEYIESNECVDACGADRMTVGFSTEELSFHSFTAKMCSAHCRNNCANLVDLYSNIIAGEGLTLSEFCGERRRAQLLAYRRLIDTTAEAPAPL